MSNTKSPSLRRLRLDGRAWFAFAALTGLWLLTLLGWPLLGHEAAWALSGWIHPGGARNLDLSAGALFGGMAPADILTRFGLYALETAVVGLVGWLGLAFIAGERPARLLTDAPRFRLELAAFGVLACAGAILAQRAALTLATGAPMDLGWGVGALLAQGLWGACLLVLTLMVGFFEEAIFRGGLLRLAPRSPWLVPFALVLNAVLFAAVHGVQSPVEFVDRVALGMALGWATLRTRGIELAVGIHAGFDFATLLLHPGQLERAPWLALQPSTPVAATGPGVPLMVELAAAGLMALVFSLLAIVLAEIAVRFAGGPGLRQPRPVGAPEAWVLDEPEPVQT